LIPLSFEHGEWQSYNPGSAINRVSRAAKLTAGNLGRYLFTIGFRGENISVSDVLLAVCCEGVFLWRIRQAAITRGALDAAVGGVEDHSMAGLVLLL
jgi:hypothetical protein